MTIKKQHIIKLPLPTGIIGWEHQLCLRCNKSGSWTGGDECWSCGGDIEIWVYPPGLSKERMSTSVPKNKYKNMITVPRNGSMTVIIEIKFDKPLKDFTVDTDEVKEVGKRAARNALLNYMKKKTGIDWRKNDSA